jgi:putative oxidoreductase
VALDAPDPRELRRYDIGLLILRLGFGLGFVYFHGWGKIVGGPDRWAGVGGAMGNFGITAGAQWWGLAAALAETAGALCIAAGLFFRPMALALAFVMLAATVNHVVTGQGTPAHSFKNIWVFLGIAVIGPGRYSVDAWLEDRRG